MEKVMETKFFNVKNIRMYYNELFTKVANEFSNMTDKDILSYDKEDLINYLYSKYEPETLVLNDLDSPDISMKQMSVNETRRDMFSFYDRNATYQVAVEYMFWYFKIRLTGNINAVDIQPSNFTYTLSGTDYENIDINKYSKNGIYELTVTIKIELQEASTNPNIKDIVYNEFKKSLELFQKNLNSVNAEINSIKSTLKTEISNMVQKRINIINASNSVFEKFAIPVTTKNSISKPIILNKKIVELPNKKKLDSIQYFVEDTDVKEINEHIFTYCSSMERNPSAYKNSGEEDIRFTILSSLNTRFSNATGETFSHKGKTDIFIGKLDKMAYIAECKIWSDKTKLKEAVSQLLSYTTWKECTGTLLIFNKANKDFKKLLSNIENIIKEIDNIVSYKKIKDNLAEFQIKKQETEDIMKITLMVFDYNV